MKSLRGRMTYPQWNQWITEVQQDHLKHSLKRNFRNCFNFQVFLSPFAAWYLSHPVINTCFRRAKCINISSRGLKTCMVYSEFMFIFWGQFKKKNKQLMVQPFIIYYSLYCLQKTFIDASVLLWFYAAKCLSRQKINWFCSQC